MKTIYFVRHGETQSNIDKLFSGSIDNPPLTKKGLEQAKEAGEKLIMLDKVDLVVSSPLLRARDTAKIIAEEVGYDSNNIVYNELLVERSFGFYDGKPRDEYNLDDENSTVQDKGESVKDFYHRAIQAFDWLKNRDEQTILVVSHGGMGRMFRLVDRNISHDDYHVVESFGNCEIDEFTI